MCIQTKERQPASRLSGDIQVALDDFTQRVLALFPGEITRIILYGSHARGEAAPDSDLDVMLVVTWNDPQKPNEYYLGGPGDPRWRRITNEAIDVMIAHGPYLSALVVGDSLFNSNFEVAEAARKEGKVLWSNPLT